MRNRFLPLGCIAAFACAIVLSSLPVGAHTRSLDILYYFSGSHGKRPGPVTMDLAGNLYGVTSEGGAYACGVVFKLAPDGTETVLHNFTKQDCRPIGVILGADGSLYGSASYSTRLFKLAPDGAYSIIYEFTGNEQGWLQVFDKEGNIYGGSWNVGYRGCGAIFKLTPSGEFSHVFVANSVKFGCGVTALVGDATGNVIYGTMASQQTDRENWGIIFKLTPDGAMTVLHKFLNPRNGGNPSGLTIDAAGNLYGTTANGGHGCENYDPSGCGTVFRLTADGMFTVLHKFQDGRDLVNPRGNPVLDENHNLYGSTPVSLYRISTDGKLSVLYRGPVTYYSYLSRLLWNNGALYGGGGGGGKFSSKGEIFRLKP